MEKLLEIAIKAALDAGNEILKIYRDPDSDFEIERKADNSPLTVADRRSNETIMIYLTDTPYPVISEENKEIAYSDRKDWPVIWIVDPLDGTKEFIKRNGEFTVNIALVKEGIPVAGVVYIPEKDILYFGAAGYGAFRTDKASAFAAPSLKALEAASHPLPLSRAENIFTIVASRSHMSPETEAFIEGLRQEHGEVRLTSIGSSIKICLIAEGSADIYPRFAPTMEWDTAAGHAVVKAAGKEIYCQDNRTPLVYNKEDLHNPWFVVR